MGKGTILSGGTAGLYTVRLSLNRTVAQKMIAKIQENITQYTGQIATLTSRIAALQTEINALQATIDALMTDPKANQSAISAALTTQTQKIISLETLNKNKSTIALKIQAAQARIDYITNNLPADPEIPAWCADLTEDLTGEVATAEVPDERGTVLIRPGYADAAAYNAARDGQLFPAIAQDPLACYYNWAMLPGTQKWLPTYRFGVITAIDYDTDTCSLTLEAAASTAQDLDVNKATDLTAVPIEYMCCNSAPFDVGDAVIVQCANTIDQASKTITTTYKVIGFKTDPKGCGSYAVFLVSGNGDKAAAIIWDCDNDELVLGPIDTDDPSYTLWIASHKSTGEDMFGDLQRDNIPPYVWHPELVDPDPQAAGDEIYYHYSDLVAYWRNVLPVVSPQEITGARNYYRKTTTLDTVAGWFYILMIPFKDSFYYKYANVIEDPSGDELWALFPDAFAIYLMVVEVNKKITYTREFFGPFGSMGIFKGGNEYVSNQYVIEGTETTLVDQYPNPSGPRRFFASQTGKKRLNMIAVATVIQYQPYQIYTHGLDGDIPYADVIIPPVVTRTFGDRAYHVQARACAIPDGQTWLDCPENETLNSKLAEALAMYYTLNPSTEGIDCTITITLMG